MKRHSQIESGQLRKSIRNGELTLAGNANLLIFGTLRCKSGKKMKASNRVFFTNESEAIQKGFRPCGHCLPSKYKVWKKQQEAG